MGADLSVDLAVGNGKAMPVEWRLFDVVGMIARSQVTMEFGRLE
jgi:hypothetical protein